MKVLTVYDYIALAFVLAASIFGIVRMFAKKAPMYFRLIVCGVWCFTFQYIYYFLAILCKMDMSAFLLSGIAFFSCFLRNAVVLFRIKRKTVQKRRIMANYSLGIIDFAYVL